MKIRYKIRITLLLFLTTWFVSACDGSYSDYQQYKEVKKVQDATPAFTTTFYKDARQRHLAVYFEMVDGGLKLSDKSAESRPGNLPYRSRASGNLIVVYRDLNGKELGRYATQDPILARSCETENGLVGQLKPFPDGTITEILLPNNPKIRGIEFSLHNQKPHKFTIGKQIDEGLKVKGKEKPG